MVHNGLYPRDSSPFGVTWEKWSSIWCNWQLSMPRNRHPAIDSAGRDCARNQSNKYVWFLTGTFGNAELVKRNCKVPRERSILFPVIYKEDSFAEDLDLHSESELLTRAREFMDRVTYLKTTVDEEELIDINEYRIESEFFDLVFPKNNLYEVEPGFTRSVCDGYWIFLKPLPLGEHRIHFSGMALMPADDIVTRQVKQDSIYAHFCEYLNKYSKFKVDVLYDILVV